MKHSGIWVPKAVVKPGYKFTNVVFYVHAVSKRILVGFPEPFPAPDGFWKVVARNAREVEIMSEKMRDQDRRDQQMSDEEREAFEAPIRAWARGQLHHAMANSRNQINRDFCKAALARMDEDDAKRARNKKESYMHIEGYEDGK